MSRLPTLRAELAGLAPAELLKRAPLACRAIAAAAVTVLAMRSGGAAVTPELRDEMLAKCAAGAYVELEVDILAYEQQTGVSNRNYVRFREGSLVAMGRTGVGRPLLRDHEQRDSMARAGTIIASKTEKRGEGDYAIVQTARITALWAVELALRGLLDGVSIGWNPTAPVMCSACDAAIFTKCWHCPGDRLAEVDTEDGGKRKVRKADGPITVEWIFTEAELVETSVVSVPAVPSAHIEGIRAALALDPQLERGDEPQETLEMKLFAVLVTTLGLAATVGEDEVIAAVDKLKRDRDTKAKELSIAEAEVATLSTEVETYREAKAQTDEDKFIAEAQASGRLGAGETEVGVWRDLYQLDATRAIDRMSKRKAGSVTPVGKKRQSDNDDGKGGEGDKATAGAAGDPKVKAAFEATGIHQEASMAFARKFGAKNPAGTALKIVNGEEV